mmetsp:Transcript_34205/g.33798  ORF Transcript_34205/g.33798 Transcript_34205/m.33798 type:complete len:230 (+) Transcript_34205:992-1681(+)
MLLYKLKNQKRQRKPKKQKKLFIKSRPLKRLALLTRVFLLMLLLKLLLKFLNLWRNLSQLLTKRSQCILHGMTTTTMNLKKMAMKILMMKKPTKKKTRRRMRPLQTRKIQQPLKNKNKSSMIISHMTKEAEEDMAEASIKEESEEPTADIEAILIQPTEAEEEATTAEAEAMTVEVEEEETSSMKEPEVAEEEVETTTTKMMATIKMMEENIMRPRKKRMWRTMMVSCQ